PIGKQGARQEYSDFRSVRRWCVGFAAFSRNRSTRERQISNTKREGRRSMAPSYSLARNELPFMHGGAGGTVVERAPGGRAVVEEAREVDAFDEGGKFAAPEGVPQLLGVRKVRDGAAGPVEPQ